MGFHDGIAILSEGIVHWGSAGIASQIYNLIIMIFFLISNLKIEIMQNQ